MNTPSSTQPAAMRGLVVALLTLLMASGCTDFKRWAYARGDRDSWQQTARVVASLGLEAGDRVADLGAGGGYFTFHLADAVGTSGRVFAVDVDEAMNEALQEDVDERSASNVEVVLGGYDGPGLPKSSVDLVFTSNTYHHIQDRVAYFKRVTEALSDRGRIAIIDFKPEGFFQKRHATARDTIRSEMQSAGYVLAESFDYLERQTFQVFVPTR